MKKVIAIIGSGMMGSALAFPAAENGHEVRLVGTHLDRDIIDECRRSNKHPKFDRAFPVGVKYYQIEEYREAVAGADFVIGGVSSFGVDWFLNEILVNLDPRLPVLSVTKGLINLEDGTLISYPDYWRSELKKRGVDREVCAVGGPCTSYELVFHDQTEVAFCGRDTASLRLFKETLSTSYYHISLTHDVIGLESAVALKNAYALAVAMTIGLVNRHHGADAGLHYNSQAGAFYQAVKEMRRLLKIQQATEDCENIGIGDLYVTVYGGRTRRIGILLGVLLYRLLFLVLMKLTGLNGTIGFAFSAKAVGSTMLLFGLTFVINFLLSLRQIHVSQPVELLHGGAQGEREPKTKLLTAVLGFMLLGVGYYLALTCQSSMDALDKFFNAIALVMVGTYCLFSAGSIAFLKILKKNKNYYYQTRHFTSISGMLYRMKQNAVGLANICILSTGVLLVISISTCLWTGIEEVTYTRFPHQISIEANTGVSGIMKTVEPVSQKMIEEVKTGIDQHLEEKQLRKKYESDQRYYVMLAAVDRNKVEKTQSDDAAASTLIKIMEESEYNQVTGEQVELEPGQALVFQAKQKNYGYDTIELGNQMYEVKKWNTDKKSYILDEKTQVYETMTVVTRNHEAKEAYAAVQGKEIQLGICSGSYRGCWRTDHSWR